MFPLPVRTTGRETNTPPATAEIDRLVILVSTLKRESEVAHQLLETYRQLLSSTRHVMNRRLPLHVSKAKLVNARDKAAIADMVAKIDKLQMVYSPHKVNGDAEKPV